ncbi:3-phenylpropionate/cinnamic acid dioxygenase subunit beta [Blastococcus sp. SYSU D00669]
MSTTAHGAARISRRSDVGAATHHEIEQFLYDEADLLDSWQFDEWLTLIAPDIHYWMPTRTNRLQRQRHLETGGLGDAAYFDETYEHLEQRVRRLRTGMAWAEDPPSRTRHMVSNVRVRSTDIDGTYELDCAFFIYRTRLEREMDMFVGRRNDVVRRAANAYGFEIARRTILLDQATLLAKNLSIFF